MVSEDKSLFARLKPLIGPADRLAILSPLKQGEYEVFERFTPLSRWRWNLNRPGRRRFDWIIASNVFMYSPEPARWLRNVLACCRYFVMIDLVRRQRSRDRELGTDGDRVRYRVDDTEPRLEGYFDLRHAGVTPLNAFAYSASGNEYRGEAVHGMALFPGRVATPMLRIDDYPSGVRPLPEDMSGLHGVLEQIEDAGVPYHLGIVPALLDVPMRRFLRSLKHMVPLVHGYDHGYPRFAPRLVANGDLTNERSIGPFDEFAFSRSAVVHERLSTAKRIVEDACETPVTGYIPPCNRGNRRVGAVLEALGFEYYLSENRISGCELPWIPSDFYGRSTNFIDAPDQRVVTLHLTWEWDLIRSGQSRLGELLADLRRRHEAVRQEQHRIRDAVDLIAGEVSVRELEAA